MTINDSQSLAGHSLSISTLTMNSSLKMIQKGKAPCRSCCWKGRYCWPGVESMGWILCPYRYKPKICSWKAEVGVHCTKTCYSIRKFNCQVPQIYKQKQTIINPPPSFISPSGLNLSQGITATLVDQVVQYPNRGEDARNGIDLDKLARQRKETVATNGNCKQ